MERDGRAGRNDDTNDDDEGCSLFIYIFLFTSLCTYFFKLDFFIYRTLSFFLSFKSSFLHSFFNPASLNTYIRVLFQIDETVVINSTSLSFSSSSSNRHGHQCILFLLSPLPQNRHHHSPPPTPFSLSLKKKNTNTDTHTLETTQTESYHNLLFKYCRRFLSLLLRLVRLIVVCCLRNTDDQCNNRQYSHYRWYVPHFNTNIVGVIRCHYIHCRKYNCSNLSYVLCISIRLRQYTNNC